MRGLLGLIVVATIAGCTPGSSAATPSPTLNAYAVAHAGELAFEDNDLTRWAFTPAR